MPEVICSGLNVVDLLAQVPGEVPVGQKTVCEQILLQGGAPAGNAACGLAALGHRVSFLGYMSDHPLAQIAKMELMRHGVSDELLVNHPGAVPAIAIVQIDDQGERTVLYSMNNYQPFNPKDLDESLMCQANLVLVDGYDIPINTHLLVLAKKHDLPSVLDLEGTDKAAMTEMMILASHAILPLVSAQFLSNRVDVGDCLRALSRLTCAQLVITDGSRGAFAWEDNQVLHQPAFAVNVVDTTGCGDAFHAGYASALLQGMALKNRLTYASFFAAQVARHFGGRTYFPNRHYMHKNCPLSLSMK